MFFVKKKLYICGVKKKRSFMLSSDKKEKGKCEKSG